MKLKVTKSKVRALRDAMPSVPLVERLISAGLIGKQQLQLALRKQAEWNEPLARVLVKLGLTSSGILDGTLDDMLDEAGLELANMIPDPELRDMLPETFTRLHYVLPIHFDEAGQILTLAVKGPLDVATMDGIASILGEGISIVTRVADSGEIEAAITRCYGYETSIPGILAEIERSGSGLLHTRTENQDYSQPLVRLVDAILADAAKRGAAALHFELEAGFLRVRYRIDGILRHILTLHRDYWTGMAARLKMLAQLDVAFDSSYGQQLCTVFVAGRRLQLKVAFCDTVHGENVVVRIKDRQEPVMRLRELGLDKQSLALLQIMMARPEGLIVVAGPADSGKTTTLFAMLDYRNDESIKILTLQDPVECPLPMVQQCSAMHASASSSAVDMESLSLQDADIVAIDEPGSPKKAAAALRLAQTGHQVMATLYSGSALAALSQLAACGWSPQTIAENVVGIVGQRLVRRLCVSCKQAYSPDRAEREILGIAASEPPRLYREGACVACGFAGYKGRVGVFEVLKVNSKLKNLIERSAGPQVLREAVSKSGFNALAVGARRHVFDGVTSLSEVSRVVDLTAGLGEPD